MINEELARACHAIPPNVKDAERFLLAQREARATCRSPCPLGIPLRRRHRGDWHGGRL
jgi:hypothetical protein